MFIRKLLTARGSLGCQRRWKAFSFRNASCLESPPKPPSVGSVGDSYDNALAESVIGLCETEVIHRRGPWRNLEAVEFATLEWVDWLDHRRLSEPIGNVPPTEFEAVNYRNQKAQAHVA